MREGYEGRRSRCETERQRSVARERSEPRNKPDPERSEGARPNKKTKILEKKLYICFSKKVKKKNLINFYSSHYI